MLKLVILPGLDGTGARIAPFLRELAPRMDARVIPYPCERPMGYADLELLVRRALPSEARFALLAESFSGPLAIRLAADPPPGLAAVILCATFAKNPFPWLGPVGALAARVPFKQLPRWVRAPLLWGSTDPRRAPAAARRASASVSAAVLRRRLREILSVDESARLECIDLPILILTASRDRIVPGAAARLLVQRTRGAQLAAIDGPHLLLQSRPAECACAILRFLQRWN